jgi:hypothetical protein
LFVGLGCIIIALLLLVVALLLPADSGERKVLAEHVNGIAQLFTSAVAGKTGAQ